MKKRIKIILIIVFIVVILAVAMKIFVEKKFNYLVEKNIINNCCPCKDEMAMYDVCCDCTETLSFLEKLGYIIDNNK